MNEQVFEQLSAEFLAVVDPHHHALVVNPFAWTKETEEKVEETTEEKK